MNEEDDEPEQFDPMDRFEALETRCNALESMLALAVVELARADFDTRMRIVLGLQKLEAGTRARNVHDEAIDAVRRVRLLIAGEDED